MARDLIMTLQYLFAGRGEPEHLRSDNGPEFVAKKIQEWRGRHACALGPSGGSVLEKSDTSTASMAGSATRCSTGNCS